MPELKGQCVPGDEKDLKRIRQKKYKISSLAAQIPDTTHPFRWNGCVVANPADTANQFQPNGSFVGINSANAIFFEQHISVESVLNA
jgi:hypothetical protein